MTLSEFKAWFEGFSEGIDKAPTEKQFAKIKAKVAEIDGAPITYPIYIDRYLPHWPTYYHAPWIGAGTVGGTGIGAVWQNGAGSSSASLQLQSAADYDSHAAMNALGRAEALN